MSSGFLKLEWIMSTLPDSMAMNYCSANNIDYREAVRAYETRSYIPSVLEDDDWYDDSEMDYDG
jgi:hypothetical protein